MSILREANRNRLTASLPLVRAVVGALVVLLVPALLSLGALREDGTIEVGTVAPRTIIADETITIVDQDATETARRQAAEAVPARTAPDPEARAALPQPGIGGRTTKPKAAVTTSAAVKNHP